MEEALGRYINIVSQGSIGPFLKWGGDLHFLSCAFRKCTVFCTFSNYLLFLHSKTENLKAAVRTQEFASFSHEVSWSLTAVCSILLDSVTGESFLVLPVPPPCLLSFTMEKVIFFKGSWNNSFTSIKTWHSWTTCPSWNKSRFLSFPDPEKWTVPGKAYSWELTKCQRRCESSTLGTQRKDEPSLVASRLFLQDSI